MLNDSSVFLSCRDKMVYAALVLHDTTVLPWNRGTFFHGTGTVKVTVLPWYRNTINTAVLPHGTCRTAVIAIHHFNDYSFTW